MRMKVLLDGEERWAHAQWLRGQLWVHFSGRTFLYDPEEKKRGRSRSEPAGLAGDLLAPMPGKITKILKQKGDAVQKGEVVVIMEAMKMEYTLKADGPGVVEEIRCKPLEQVSLGKILVHISPKG